MRNELVIELNHISCQIGNKYLLKDICWNVEKGSHWVVFGLNGSGKTTLLSIIAGFQSYSDGSLKVFGEEYSEKNIFDLRKQIGWVSASFFDRYFHEESVLDIVLSGLFGTLGIENKVTADIIRKARYILHKLKLSDKSDRSFNSLSKGEQQNVLIARTLMSRPKILVLDEPGTGLDISNREDMLQFVREIAEITDITIIYVTHYVEEIMDVFDHCMFMKNGKIQKLGSTKELLSAESLSELLEHQVYTKEIDNRIYVSQSPSSDLSCFVKAVIS